VSLGDPTPFDLERAADALTALLTRSLDPFVERDLAARLPRGGISVSRCLSHLHRMGLVEPHPAGRWGVTNTGRAAAAARASGDWQPLVTAALDAGAYEADAVALLRQAAGVQGYLRLPLPRARTVAPALAAILSWVPPWRDGQYLVVPLAALQGAAETAALYLAEERPEWLERRERVGVRAEAYSLRYERRRHGAGHVVHASREYGDHLGYDIEDGSHPPSRLIEVKGSAAATVRFVLTEREAQTARESGDRYEIQFWGNIRLELEPASEYAALRSHGYPTTLRDPSQMLEEGMLTADPVAWRCELAVQN
jgi:hypothetical protein